MSAATADRLLSSQRKQSQRGLSNTRAGTLLKQQIPIRTFEEWNEARPGFLEADLVAHCGTNTSPCCCVDYIRYWSATRSSERSRNASGWTGKRETFYT